MEEKELDKDVWFSALLRLGAYLTESLLDAILRESQINAEIEIIK